jgi:hypothetical protein
MNEIITSLICSSIDKNKIPGLDFVDNSCINEGYFELILNDQSSIKIEVKYIPEQ